MPAPTFVAEYETLWTGTTTPKTASVTTAVGDVLVVVAMLENHLGTLSTPTGGTGLTWTLRQEVAASPSSDWCGVYVWTATATTAETFTLSIARGGTAVVWGFNCLRFSGSDGIGASSKTNTTGAPSLGLTTTGANSAIVVANADWAALDGTSRTWRTVNGSVGNENTYFRSSTTYGVYANRHMDAGAAGANTVGLSAPTGQSYSIAAVEVLGTSGTTITGTLSTTTPKVTASASGTERITGTVSTQTPPVTAAATGVERITGTLSTQTPKVTFAAAEGVTITGTLNTQTPKVTVGASGAVRIPGTANVTTPRVTAALAGVERLLGTIAAATPKVTVAASGAQRLLGDLSVVTPKVTPSLYGTYTPPPPVYVFTPPTEKQYLSKHHPLYRLVPINQGVTVLKGKDGIYREIRGEVLAEEVDQSAVAYLAGHDYVVTAQEASDLASAGYEEYVDVR